MKSVIVVTGASAGIGRAVVRRFAREGVKMALIARDEDRLRYAQKEVEAKGGEAIIFPLDVTNAKTLFAAADEIERTLGPIDVWINDAMVTVVSEFRDMDPEEFRRVTDVTYHGFVYGTMAALRKMYPRNKGVIVQVGSALAYRGIPLQSAYCGAKHAIQGFTESVRSELIHDRKNIQITMVQMPAVNTPQFAWCKTRMPRKPQPVAPIYEPEVAAQAVYWSAHHPHRREVNVGGRNTLIIWANKFFAGLGDRYLAKKGYESQMTDELVEDNRPYNLWETVKGPFEAHGSFDERAVKKSSQLYLTTHPWIGWAAAFIAVSFLLGCSARPKRKEMRKLDNPRR